MQPADALVNGESFHFDGTGAEAFIKPNDTLAVYFPVAPSTGTLDLSAATGTVQRRWFDPTTGLFVGTPDTLNGGGLVNVGPPPNSPGLGDAARTLDNRRTERAPVHDSYALRKGVVEHSKEMRQTARRQWEKEPCCHSQGAFENAFLRYRPITRDRPRTRH